MSGDTVSDGFRNVGSAEDLHEAGRATITVDGRSIALFSHEGEIHAVDNRCPHMGFPLSQGSVDNGILTCHWHHARFELSCGSTFDPFADDVESFPVEVRDGEVWINPAPDGDHDPGARWAERLEDGLEENLRLVLAKSVIGLDDAGVDAVEPVWAIADFGTTYRDDGWGSGLTILAAMANLLGDIRPEDRRRALYTGAVRVANECAGAPPRFVQEPFEDCSHDADRLDTWFRECVEVRDRRGAERVLRTAIRANHPPSIVIGMLVGAATDHRYLDTGHTMDFINKACELLDHVGWEHADQVLPSLVPGLVTAQRSEERSSWRQPVDLVSILDAAFESLPESVPTEATWQPPDDFVATLLEDDPDAVIGAIEAAIDAGALPETLAEQVCLAAARRVAQFSTGNEFRDWNTVHHTYTYANAVQRLCQRTDAVSTYRAVYDGAVNVYLDRFLNTPPASIPPLESNDTVPNELRDSIFETFDEEGETDRAGRLVAQYLGAGGDIGSLKQVLAEGLLREDANFHTLQNVEVAFRQADLASTDETAAIHLIATARYLAAHTPTRREAEQTFTIASRLHRGENIHET